MERRITLLIPGRARCCFIVHGRGMGHFEWMYVDPRYRRNGYCFELLKFAIRYASLFLEMDIRHQSKIPQRHAKRLGYSRVGESKRFIGCALWRHKGPKRRFPSSRLRLRNRVLYNGARWKTEVLYLSGEDE